MFIVAVVVSIVLAVVLSGSAYAKLTKNPQVVESLVGRVGVPEDRLWMLAGLELAGAAGLIIGLFWAPLGIAAAIGVILYFIGALIAHVRAGDTPVASLAPPAVILVVAVITLVLRLTTA
jgi:uncharacterized membrane protein YphA (DoxX/SURF4 family)